MNLPGQVGVALLRHVVRDGKPASLSRSMKPNRTAVTTTPLPVPRNTVWVGGRKSWKQEDGSGRDQCRRTWELVTV